MAWDVFFEGISMRGKSKMIIYFHLFMPSCHQQQQQEEKHTEAE